MKKMLLTHSCGRHEDTIDLNKINPVKNIHWNKPAGGFWLSINNSWEEWCSSEMPEWLNPYRYQVTLDKNANIFWIYGEEDLKDLPINPLMKDSHRTPSEGCWGNFYIDFEAMAEKYDGMGVMIQSGDYGFLYYALYGWDCDSLVVFNPEIVKSLRRISAWEK